MNNTISLMCPDLHCKVHEDDTVGPLIIIMESVPVARSVFNVRRQQPVQ
jgi:hypothetical protein